MSVQHPSEFVLDMAPPCRGTVVLHLDGTRTCTTCLAGGRPVPAEVHQRAMACPGCRSCAPTRVQDARSGR